MIKASVVIPTKNPGAIFKKVLAAVLEQETDFDYEILVVDSGSEDETVDYVRLTAASDQRLCLHQIDPASFGHGKTRNQAIALTSGEYIAMITHDACPVNNSWLQHLVSIADRNQKIAGVFGRHIAYPDANILTIRELELHFAGFSPLVHLEDAERYEKDEVYRQFLHFFSDNNALLRRKVWESIPYPDVDFAEDQLWMKQIIEAGWAKAYAQDAAVYHSHDYALPERLQRSFDESYAFKRYFGYVLCKSIGAMVRTVCALIVRDYQYLRSTGLWKTNIKSALLMPVDHFMRIFGHYLGGRADSLNDSVRKLLSRDYRVHTSLLKLKP